MKHVWQKKKMLEIECYAACFVEGKKAEGQVSWASGSYWKNECVKNFFDWDYYLGCKFLGLYSSVLTIRSCKTKAEPIFYISLRTAFVWAKDVPSIFIKNYFPSLTRFLYLQPLDDFSSGFGSVFIDSKANVQPVTNRPNSLHVTIRSHEPTLAFLVNPIVENRWGAKFCVIVITCKSFSVHCW